MTRYGITVALAALLAAGCSHDTAPSAAPSSAAAGGAEFTVTAAPREGTVRVAGTAEPVQQATLSTRLMGTVLAVEVHEGDVVRRGQQLVRIDARDLAAKAAQLEAALAEAAAVHAEAEVHARRMRALYADDAAPRAQLDAAETGLVRARAGMDAVRASALELAAMRDYAVVRAPFDGVVVSRMVDPGSFAAPGAPLLVIHDVSSLRVTATAAPELIRGLARGARLAAEIEGQPAPATVEGVVPAVSGSLYAVNALVSNPERALLPRGAAVLALPQGTRTSIVVPRSALVHQGDLVGVHLRRDSAALLRWVRIGTVSADSAEILSGLRTGDVIIVPGR